jgi:outer membrane receptor protein involved in Fe transport
MACVLFQLDSRPLQAQTFAPAGPAGPAASAASTPSTPKDAQAAAGTNGGAAAASVTAEEWIARAQQAGLLIVSTLSGTAIGAWPAVNLAQRLDMLPGVTVDRDLGDARFVRIRGLDPRWTAVRFDGDRLPSPDAASRVIPLNLIPATMFESAAVARSASADMDGDAIGGAVNLVTGVPAEQGRALASVSGGYHAQRSDAGEIGGHATFGRRVRGGAVGLLGSVTALAAPLSAGGVETSYLGSPILPRPSSLDIVSDVVDRQQHGAFGALDLRRSEQSHFTVRGLFGRVKDHTVERRTTFAAGSDAASQRSVWDGETTDIIGMGGVQAQHVLSRDFLLDYRVTGGYGGRSRPDALLTPFTRIPRTADVPNMFINALQTMSADRASERTLQASANVTRAFAEREGFRASVKAGAKLLLLNRSRDVDTAQFYPSNPQRLDQAIGESFDPGTFLDGRYVLGPQVDPDLARGFARPAGALLPQMPDSVVDDYHASERTGAAFVLTELAIGRRLLIAPGVRYEATRYDYRADTLLVDFEGYSGPTAARGTRTDGEWLPMVNARYAFTSSLLLRASVTRTLARPDYGYLAPYGVLGFSGVAGIKGNPDLRPTLSWNSDAMLERTLGAGGSLFGGVFRKAITQPIFLFNDGPTIQPRNGDDATLWGAETGYQQRLAFLPSALRPLTLWVNYTFAHTRAALPARSGDGTVAIYPDIPGRDVTLPSVPRHAGHLAVSYDRERLTARTTIGVRGPSLDRVGQLAYLDILQQRRTQVDASFGARLTPAAWLFADFYNLTSAPLRFYQDRPSLPTIEQDYRWWASFGVRLTF